ncbi:MAG: transcriptional regulator MraZ [Actinobacteria bacterium]|nr:MAG: transcriptional regulator MraZ [Actinomycetota bacterium]
MFLGEFHHSLDNKGRIIIPAKFRDALTDGMVITRGFDRCLMIIAKRDWPGIEDGFKSTKSFTQNKRKLGRALFAQATEEDIDKQGRVFIPSNLRDFAGLTKDVVIVGVSNRLEIWDEKAWAQYLSEAEEHYDGLADEMAELGF